MMTVKLKIVPQADWAILSKYLDAEGVVLVPESNQAGIKRLANRDIHDDEDIYYDFGGDANVWVDIAFDEDSYPINELCDDSGY